MATTKANPEVDILHYREGLIWEHTYKMVRKSGGLKINPGHGKIYYCYNYGLASFLQMTDFTCWNCETKDEEYVNGRDYLPAFMRGFDAGKEQFQKDWLENRFRDSATIGESLEKAYLHGLGGHRRGSDAWCDHVENRFPRFIDDKTVEEAGFYSGLVHEYKEFKLSHTELFKNQNPENSRGSEPTNFQPVTLKSLFKDRNEYYQVEALAKEHFLGQDGDVKTELLSIPNIHRKYLRACFGLMLIKYGYLNEVKAYKLIKGLRHFYGKEDISDNAITRIKNLMNKQDDVSRQYEDIFSFLTK